MYPLEYYAVLRNDEIMQPGCRFAATWVEMKGFMLSELSQREEDKYQCSYWAGAYRVVDKGMKSSSWSHTHGPEW